MDYERLFLENLSTIERLARSIALRHRLPPDARDDFAGLVRLRFLEGNYRILREFEGRSALTTYLTVVITRLFLDHRNQEWGRWRPSARARSLGPDAIMLEQLVKRDGHSVHEAIQIMTVTHRLPASEPELYALWAALPDRPRPARVPEAMAALVAAPDVPAENETREDRVLIGEALARTVAGLPTIERLLLKLHFVRGVPLVDVAARLRLSKATIHRRMSRAIAACRAGVAAAGIEPGRAHGLALERNDEIAAILEGIDETIPPPGRLTPRDE